MQAVEKYVNVITEASSLAIDQIARDLSQAYIYIYIMIILFLEHLINYLFWSFIHLFTYMIHECEFEMNI